MNTVYLFYKSFCILKIKVGLISCMWSKVQSKAGENNGLMRPLAESVPGLNNREIAPISSPHEVGVENQTTLASPLESELVGVIWLTPCSFGCIAAIRCDNPCHGPQSDSSYSGSEHRQFNSPRLVKREAGFPNPWRALIGSNQLWCVNDSPYYRE